jgi:hypothetical protein
MTDPLADIEAVIDQIKQVEQHQRLGSFGTRIGDIILTKAQLDILWQANPTEFKDMTGHTLESFEQEVKDNSMVEFGHYRAMISYPMED